MSNRERAELFARLPLATLRKARDDAASRGDLRMADEALAAINLRARSQHEEIADGGQLFEHIEQPSPQNGGRFVTTYTGDPLAWMSAFMAPGAIGTINRSPGVVARVSVDLRAGERVQIIGRDGKARSA